MSDLTGLAAGDAIVVHDSQGRYSHREVTKVARVWLTDDTGHKFRRDNGHGEDRDQIGYGYYAVTVPEWEVAEETIRLTKRLVAWGWVPSARVGSLIFRGNAMSLSQLRRAAALLSEFESENTGGRL